MKQSLIIKTLPYFKDIIKHAIESSLTMSLLSNLAFSNVIWTNCSYLFPVISLCNPYYMSSATI